MIQKLLDKLRKSEFINKLLGILGGGEKGIGKVCVNLMYGWYKKHPTSDMQKSVVFYKTNRDIVLKNLELLADDKSKFLYTALIEFRCTMNRKVHPGCDKPQYFVKEIFQLNDNEVFLDCGGYDGENTIDFIKECEGSYVRICIFEPDPKCRDLLQNRLPNDERIFVIAKGLWNKTTQLSFVSSGDAVSRIVESTELMNQSVVQVPVTTIDECDLCKNATFIKMDIEGSEMKALEGAKNTIKKNKPKLAISIYHSDSDMVHIIQYIHNLVPEYKLYIRHHSIGYIDTVLYAVI